MRDLDPEGLVIDTIKAAMPDLTIYAGWPGWEVPPGIEATTNLLNITPDHSEDISGAGMGVIAPVIVNIWGLTEEEARSTAVAVVNALNLKKVQPSEGASVWFIPGDIKPQHEPDPAGTIYRFIIDITVKTYEEV